MSGFKPNRHFKRDYDRLFRQDPAAANVFLLLAELADKKGQVETNEAELACLMAVRFTDSRVYQLGGAK